MLPLFDKLALAEDVVGAEAGGRVGCDDWLVTVVAAVVAEDVLGVPLLVGVSFFAGLLGFESSFELFVSSCNAPGMVAAGKLSGASSSSS